MSKFVMLSFLTLPVELVYRILDHIDDITLFCSIRDVCTRFNTIIDTYHRYQVNFNVIEIIDRVLFRFIKTITTLILNRRQSDLVRDRFFANILQQRSVIAL